MVNSNNGHVLVKGTHEELMCDWAILTKVIYEKVALPDTDNCEERAQEMMAYMMAHAIAKEG